MTDGSWCIPDRHRVVDRGGHPGQGPTSTHTSARPGTSPCVHHLAFHRIVLWTANISPVNTAVVLHCGAPAQAPSESAGSVAAGSVAAGSAVVALAVAEPVAGGSVAVGDGETLVPPPDAGPEVASGSARPAVRWPAKRTVNRVNSNGACDTVLHTPEVVIWLGSAHGRSRLTDQNVNRAR